MFSNPPTPLTICPGTSLREASRGINCWLERRDLYTPFWGQPNPCDYCLILSCISCASWQHSEPLWHHWKRLMWGCLVHIPLYPFLMHAVFSNLPSPLLCHCFLILFPPSVSLSTTHPPFPLCDGWGGWGGGGKEEISEDYHCLENTDGFVRHRRSWMLCQPALD